MTPDTFADLLGNLIESALRNGLPIAEVHDCLVIAGMVLDDRRPVPASADEAAPF